ncbi:hypothetical protein RHMOL_Rhmol01G0295000 [Rhododendron molle]|uniref:Uncharacterized protein n=1 Tax=Rhododendron molle TaxID=49168 RepID=A0ACC0Q895_RHOML|nr:hypothetical protein RHMOL_Rhmol01G0295000 [Rhododendron molle]
MSNPSIRGPCNVESSKSSGGFKIKPKILKWVSSKLQTHISDVCIVESDDVVCLRQYLVGVCKKKVKKEKNLLCNENYIFTYSSHWPNVHLADVTAMERR